MYSVQHHTKIYSLERNCFTKASIQWYLNTLPKSKCNALRSKHPKIVITSWIRALFIFLILSLNIPFQKKETRRPKKFLQDTRVHLTHRCIFICVLEFMGMNSLDANTGELEIPNWDLDSWLPLYQYCFPNFWLLYNCKLSKFGVTINFVDLLFQIYYY